MHNDILRMLLPWSYGCDAVVLFRCCRGASIYGIIYMFWCCRGVYVWAATCAMYVHLATLPSSSESYTLNTKTSLACAHWQFGMRRPFNMHLQGSMRISHLHDPPNVVRVH